eukprot:gene31046-35034_t
MFARLAFRNKRIFLGKGALACLCVAAAYPIVHQRKTACEEEDRKGWSLENVEWPELKTEEDTDDLVFVEVPEQEDSTATGNESEAVTETAQENVAANDSSMGDDKADSEPKEDKPVETGSNPATVVVEEEEDEDDAAWLEEKSKCAFCKMFIFSPCKKHFKKWSNCVDKAKEEEKDFAEVCSEYTRALMECTSEHTEFFKALSSEESSEEGNTANSATPAESEIPVADAVP